jgi:hypothetical protein
MPDIEGSGGSKGGGGAPHWHGEFFGSYLLPGDGEANTSCKDSNQVAAERCNQKRSTDYVRHRFASSIEKNQNLPLKEGNLELLP